MAYMTGNKLEKREGEYDAKYHVFFSKDDKGWSATDEFTGAYLGVTKPTKKEAQEALKLVSEKIDELRSSEKYLHMAVNFNELKNGKGII